MPSQMLVGLVFAAAVSAAAARDACNGVCDKVTKALTCTAGCKGIDVDICFGTHYILCKGGCLGIHSCVKKCEKKLVEPCKKKLIDGCYSKCNDKVVKPCEEGCHKEGFAICKKVVAKAAETIEHESCSEICIGAAVAADAAGAGPADPVADAVALEIKWSCKAPCGALVEAGLSTVDEKFAGYLCNKIGFGKGFNNATITV